MKTKERTFHHVLVLLLTTVAALSIVGCKHNDALVFASNKQVGVKVGVDSKQIPEVSVGFNSQDFALVPVYKAGSPDAVSANHASVAGALRAANEALARAEAGFENDKLPVNEYQTLQVADDLIRSANRLAAAGGTKAEKESAKSQLLVMLQEHSAELLANKTQTKEKLRPRIAHLRSLIGVEINRPALLAEFDPQLKYIGRANDGVREDAYSVFGSFSGRGGVKTQGGEVKGGLAQFFSTGVAAQLLASEGGAAAVSTEAKSPAEFKYDADQVRVQAQQEHAKEMQTAVTQVRTQADLADRLVEEASKEKDLTKRRQLVNQALDLNEARSKEEFPEDKDLENLEKIRRLARSAEYYPALSRHYNAPK